MFCLVNNPRIRRYPAHCGAVSVARHFRLFRFPTVWGGVKPTWRREGFVGLLPPAVNFHINNTAINNGAVKRDVLVGSVNFTPEQWSKESME